jgi:uncharacterized protein (TIGR02391 family)
LSARILTSYHQGLPLVVRGRTIPLAEVTRIRINVTEGDSQQLLPAVRAKRAGSSVLVLGGPSDDWYVAAEGKDVTDDYIKAPPGSKKTLASEPGKEGLQVEGLHPEVQAACGALCKDGHYSQAIFEAFKAVEIRVRKQSGLALAGRDLMAQAFALDAAVISLTELSGQSGKDEQEGFWFLFMGAMQGIRNPKGHERIEQSDWQRALEYLAFASLLLRRLDDAQATRLRSTGLRTRRRG